MKYLILFLLFFTVSKGKTQNQPNRNLIFQTNIFLNYDNVEHRVQDMKGKQVILTCISAYIKSVEKVAKHTVSFYDSTASNKNTNKDYIYIIVLFDHIRSNHLDGVYETYEIYQKIIKNMKIKSKNVFFTFEGGDTIKFSSIRSSVPFFHSGFSLDNNGNICWLTDKKMAKNTCLTPELIKIFKDFRNISDKLEDAIEAKTDIYKK